MGKRAFDVAGAALALLLLAPVLAAVALWVRLDSPGPALFRQQRVGRGGRPFLIHKFRTMHAGAGGPGWPLEGDAGITRAGRWLRRTRVDELPQLWDVLRGAMSLVGPRPELPRYLAAAPAALRARALAVRPGMTDPAALAWLAEGERLARAADAEREYVQHILPLKLQAAADYAEHASLRTDLGVLWRTARTLWGPA
jgi:lipopolysaccharide/colanic/teichoic acid biosynthesis glycosyltransferase